jgi:putative spermidine/putrescine transport system substrate-binding protein
MSCRQLSRLFCISLGLLWALFPMPSLAQETLRVLAWPGYADPDLVRVFEQRHKIKVEVTIVGSDDEMWELLSGGQGANFDVFAVNTAELQRYIDRGISVPLSPADIRNTARQLARFHNLAAIPGITRDGKVYAIPYTYSEMGLIYDRKVFRTPPASFAAMWDKRYRGRVLMYQGSTHNFSQAALVLGLRDPFHIAAGDFKRVSRHLVELRRNVLAFYAQPEEATQLYIRNHAVLLFGNYGAQQVKMLQEAGADVGYVIPKEGALAWLDCWSLSRGARNRNLAESWIDFTLEPQISHALTERQGLSNTLEESAVAQDAKLIWLQQVEDSAKRARLWDRIISGDLPERF